MRIGTCKSCGKPMEIKRSTKRWCGPRCKLVGAVTASGNAKRDLFSVFRAVLLGGEGVAVAAGFDHYEVGLLVAQLEDLLVEIEHDE